MGYKDILNAPNKGAENKASVPAEKASPTPAVAESTNPEQVILAQSKEDLFLRQLMAESKDEPEAWKSESIVVDERYKSMFELPVELRKGPKRDSRANENSYCWVEVSDERMARLYQRDGWIPVNRTNHAWLPNAYFSVHGGIERTGYSRHILFYQPKKYNEAMKMAAVKRAQDRLDTNRKKLENQTGPIRLEEIEGSSGGYGTDPGSPPIESDWQGNLTDESAAQLR